MNDIRELLERKAGRFEPDHRGWERVQRLGARRQRSPRIGAALVALVLFSAAGTSLWLALRSAGPAAHPTPGATAITTSSSSEPIVPSPLALTDLHMVTTTDGWAISRDPDTARLRVLTTKDGGSTWSDVTPTLPSKGDTYLTAEFLDATHAWVAAATDYGNNPPQSQVAVFATSDGGHTWHGLAPITLPGPDPADLHFVDLQHGWAYAIVGVAAGTDVYELFRTTDGDTIGIWSRPIALDRHSRRGSGLRTASHSAVC